MAQVFETPNNDTIATATPLGNIRTNPFVRGSLLTNDTADFYKFQVDRPTKGGIAVVPQGIDANLVLMNSSGQTIRTSLNPGTATESIAFDNLPTGEYTLLVSKNGGIGSGTYVLSANGTAITRAQLSVTVDRVKALERFDTPVPFTNFGEADFYTTTTINQQSQSSRVFGNDNDISPNFTFARDVSINTSLITANSITVRDDDRGLGNSDDLGDIDPSTASSPRFNFDVAKGEVQFLNFVGSRREGENITLQGDGKEGDTKATSISFRVNYDTFTSSTTSFSNSTPIIRGTQASQDLIGQNLGGILCGEGGNDKLSGMGGNDALCGGTGNDTLNGGTGNDISFGGAGRDTHLGGAGNDTFVLALNSGWDVIKDFQSGKDKLGLSLELGFEVLDIVQRGQDTVIGVGNERLALLSNVKANQLTASDFSSVDFTHFKGLEVPTLVS